MFYDLIVFFPYLISVQEGLLMTKRANGEGSIRTRIKVKKDGSSYTRYAAVITTECKGKTQKRLEGSSRKTKAEAIQDLAKLQKAKHLAIDNLLTLSLADYLDFWLKQIKPKVHLLSSRKQLSTKTFKGYKHDVEAFIRPELGHIKLINLKPIPIQCWQDALELSHGPYIAKNVSSTLSSALSKAVTWRLLEYNPSTAFNLLQEHKDNQKSKLGTIVTNQSGNVPTAGHLRNEFYNLCEKAQVRRIKFHGLRHTAGSLWIEAGISLLRASRWLGHSHMRTTEKIYIHLLREASYGESISLEKMLKIEALWK